jgi:pimeloyl-ACP methyl ester carboxylesterase
MSASLHYNSFGEGQPIIILHGLFGSSRNWQSIARILAKNYQVITLDLRNHGQSEYADSMTYMEMAEDVLDLINELSLENLSLIGHSMGGKVAMINALQHPSLIEKLIVLDIAPVSYEHRYGKLFQAMQDLPLNQVKDRIEAGKILNNQVNDAFLSQFLLQNLNRDENGFQCHINLPAILNNIEYISGFPDIGTVIKYDKPALFLGGKNSHFIQTGYHQTIRGYFPGAVIELIENAGHMLNIEQPDVLVDRIRQFIKY